MKKLFIAVVIELLIWPTGALSAEADHVQYNLRVDGITCPFCVASSAKSLKKLEGVQEVRADIAKGIIKVCVKASASLDDDSLSELFLDKGFIYRGKETQENCDV